MSSLTLICVHPSSKIIVFSSSLVYTKVEWPYYSFSTNTHLLFYITSQGMSVAVEKAESIVRTDPNAFSPRQFDNPANVDAHFRSTGKT